MIYKQPFKHSFYNIHNSKKLKKRINAYREHGSKHRTYARPLC